MPERVLHFSEGRRPARRKPSPTGWVGHHPMTRPERPQAPDVATVIPYANAFAADRLSPPWVWASFVRFTQPVGLGYFMAGLRPLRSAEHVLGLGLDPAQQNRHQ